MQNIVIDQPYRFVPPHRGRFWCAIFGLWLPHYLKRYHGIESVECRGVEHLQRSLAAGHGILLTSNHCRPADPMLLGMLSLKVRRLFYMMVGSVSPPFSNAFWSRPTAWISGTFRAIETSETSMCRARSSIFFSRNESGLST